MCRPAEQPKCTRLQSTVLEAIQFPVFLVASVPAKDKERGPGLTREHTAMPLLIIRADEGIGSTTDFGLKARGASFLPVFVRRNGKVVAVDGAHEPFSRLAQAFSPSFQPPLDVAPGVTRKAHGIPFLDCMFGGQTGIDDEKDLGRFSISNQTPCPQPGRLQFAPAPGRQMRFCPDVGGDENVGGPFIFISVFRLERGALKEITVVEMPRERSRLTDGRGRLGPDLGRPSVAAGVH